MTFYKEPLIKIVTHLQMAAHQLLSMVFERIHFKYQSLLKHHFKETSFIDKRSMLVISVAIVFSSFYFNQFEER